MLAKLRKALKWTVLAVVLLALLAVIGDVFRLNPAQAAAAPYVHDLVRWHATNFFSKWVHRAVTALPWNSRSREDRRRQVETYFRLQEEMASVESQLEGLAALGGDGTDTEVVDLEAELKRATARRDGLRNDVEETLEATISAVIVEEGLASWGELVFPAVDIRLTDTPALLVTSPRDRISRTHDVLLKPGIGVEQREEVEAKLMRDAGLSALVVDIGGVATYPASLRNDRSLRWTLRTSAHEWLHHYLFFRSLGQSIFKSEDMRTLNETVSDIAGRELGARAFEMLGGDPDAPSDAGAKNAQKGGSDNPEGFDFDTEMTKTRLRVDELLEEGKVEQAEAYMEQRRKLFVENGYHIRKLNQAYFAFHGTYAESPSSVSPIGDQLHELREMLPALGTFIRTMSGISSYQDFLNEFERLQSQAATP